MHPFKSNYAGQVCLAVRNNCKALTKEKNNPVLTVLGLTPKEMTTTIHKVINALPDSFFYNANSAMLDDMMDLIVKSYILFEAQEDTGNEQYVYNLISFIQALSNEIEMRYYYAY